MKRDERIALYLEMLRIAKKTQWHEFNGLCWMMWLASDANKALFLDDLPEIMAQKPKPLNRKFHGFWWPKWNIWKRRRVIKKAIKLAERAEQ